MHGHDGVLPEVGRPLASEQDELGLARRAVPTGRRAVGAVGQAGQPVGQIHFLERPDRDPIHILANTAGVLICTRAPSVVAQGDCVAVIATSRPLPFRNRHSPLCDRFAVASA